VDLDASLAGVRAPGDTVYLQIPAGQRRIAPGTTTIQFDQSEVGKFLSSFSSHFPDSVRLTGRALVNPPDIYATPSGVGRFGRSSSVCGTMNLQVPMNLGITSGTYADTMSFDGGSGGRDGLKDVNGGTVFVQVENALPVDLTLTLALLDSAQRQVLALPQNGVPIHIAAAQVDAQGQVTVHAQSSITINLSQTEVQQFIPACRVGYSIGLATTQGAATVTFHTSDFVHVKAWSEFGYRVNK